MIFGGLRAAELAAAENSRNTAGIAGRKGEMRYFGIDTFKLDEIKETDGLDVYGMGFEGIVEKYGYKDEISGH